MMSKRMMKVKKTVMMKMKMTKMMRKSPNQISHRMMIQAISFRGTMIFHQTEKMMKRMKFL